MSEDLFNDQNEEKLDWAKYLGRSAPPLLAVCAAFFCGLGRGMEHQLAVAVCLSFEHADSGAAAVDSLVVNNPAQEMQSRMDSITQQVYSRTTL